LGVYQIILEIEYWMDWIERRWKILDQKRSNELRSNLERSILRTRVNIRVIKMKQRFYDILKEEFSNTTPSTFMGIDIEIDNAITGGYSIERGAEI